MTRMTYSCSSLFCIMGGMLRKYIYKDRRKRVHLNHAHDLMGFFKIIDDSCNCFDFSIA